MKLQQVNLRWLLYAGLVLFLCKGLHLAAIDDDFIDTSALDEFKHEAAQELENGFQPRGKHTFQETINKIQGNFADNESPNTVAFQALLETAKNNAFDEMQISAKKIDWGKKFDSFLDKTKKELKTAGKKMLEKGKKGAKKVYNQLKNVTKKCFNEALIELKKLPKEIGKEFEDCAGEKISKGMDTIMENVDISKLPFANGDFKGAVDKCFAQGQFAPKCLIDQIELCVQALDTNVATEGGESKNIISTMMTDIFTCADPEKYVENGMNRVANPTIKCFMDAAMHKLEKMSADDDKEGEQGGKKEGAKDSSGSNSSESSEEKKD